MMTAALALVAWIKERWWPGWIMAGLLVVGLGQSCRSLMVCQAKLDAKPAMAQEQSQDQAAHVSAGAKVQLVYEPVPCPGAEGPFCPCAKITLTADAGTTASGSQGQKQAQTQPAPSVTVARFRRLNFNLISPLELPVAQDRLALSGSLDLYRFGPIILGGGVESPLKEWQPKGMVSASLELPWQLK